jgi:hypothetical protein
MTLVDDHQIEEVSGIVPEQGIRVSGSDHRLIAREVVRIVGSEPERERLLDSGSQRNGEIGRNPGVLVDYDGLRTYLHSRPADHRANNDDACCVGTGDLACHS